MKAKPRRWCGLRQKVGAACRFLCYSELVELNLWSRICAAQYNVKALFDIAQYSTDLCLLRLTAMWVTRSLIYSGLAVWINTGPFLLY